MSKFAANLAVGKVGESIISRYMQARGNAVLPVYEIEKSQGKGPQLFSVGKQFVAPDMLVFTANGAMFIEAKHKTVFTWHRSSQQWTTGIDIRHYGDYLRVAKETRLPVWLAFFHSESTPSDGDRAFGCPESCPTGLFVGDLFSLVTCENHRSKPYDQSRAGFVGHGKSGMVYWAASDLRLLASKESVLAAIETEIAVAA
jgi:hypothetical protein